MEGVLEDPTTRTKFVYIGLKPASALTLQLVYYFRQGPLISDIKVVEVMEVICRCLDDEVVEVREMAAT